MTKVKNRPTRPKNLFKVGDVYSIILLGRETMNKLTRLPQCCGQDMTVKLETSLYYELCCRKCGDTIYMKKESVPKPQMLDD